VPYRRHSLPGHVDIVYMSYSPSSFSRERRASFTEVKRLATNKRTGKTPSLPSFLFYIAFSFPLRKTGTCTFALNPGVIGKSFLEIRGLADSYAG
jgi:hypothetical protein